MPLHLQKIKYYWISLYQKGARNSRVLELTNGQSSFDDKQPCFLIFFHLVRLGQCTLWPSAGQGRHLMTFFWSLRQVVVMDECWISIPRMELLSTLWTMESSSHYLSSILEVLPLTEPVQVIKTETSPSFKGELYYFCFGHLPTDLRIILLNFVAMFLFVKMLKSWRGEAGFCMLVVMAATGWGRIPWYLSITHPHWHQMYNTKYARQKFLSYYSGYICFYTMQLQCQQNISENSKYFLVGKMIFSDKLFS